MILCDIGNSSINFLEDQKFSSMNVEEFLGFQSEEKIFYISVNEGLKEIS